MLGRLFDSFKKKSGEKVENKEPKPDASDMKDIAIKRMMDESEQDALQTLTCLLLGVGGSGKSTLFKQLQHIHIPDMFNKKLKRKIVSTIKENILSDLYDLSQYYTLLAADQSNKQPLLQHPIIQKYIALKNGNQNNETGIFKDFEPSDKDKYIGIMKKIQEIIEETGVEETELNDDIVNGMLSLWQHSTMQQVYNLRKLSTIMDNSPYFLNNMKHFLSADYEPSFDDYVRARDKTAGITTETFSMQHDSKPLKLNITDVGGQRSERRKWVQLFHDVDIVIYVMSLSSYNELLYEDNNVRQWDENFNVFRSVSDHKVFHQTDFIIFLNKYDVFANKIKDIPLTIYNEEFDEKYATSEENVIEYVKSCFNGIFYHNNDNDIFKSNEQFTNPKLMDHSSTNESTSYTSNHPFIRSIYYHVTSVTDSTQIDNIMNVAISQMIKKLLYKTNLI